MKGANGTLQIYNVGEPIKQVDRLVPQFFQAYRNGNGCVMTVIDCFSKWPEVYVIPDQTSDTVADDLIVECVSWWKVCNVS